MIVVRYDSDKMSMEKVVNNFEYLKNQCPEEKIICLPNNWDILFNCTIEQLERFKNDIDTVIAEKLVKGEE